MTSKDTNPDKERSQRCNGKLILEGYEVKFYNGQNSAVIFVPKEYWGCKVNVYKAIE